MSIYFDENSVMGLKDLISKQRGVTKKNDSLVSWYLSNITISCVVQVKL